MDKKVHKILRQRRTITAIVVILFALASVISFRIGDYVTQEEAIEKLCQVADCKKVTTPREEVAEDVVIVEEEIIEEEIVEEEEYAVDEDVTEDN